MYDILIIGAGPAGLSAAIYAGRSNKKVLVLEASAYGGQITKTLKIDNYPATPHISGVDFAKQLYEQAQESGAEFKFERATKVAKLDGHYKVVTNESEYQTKTIILATGRANRKLNLDNEADLLGRGISYCATCDGNFYKNKIVGVVGGGNTALYEALYLSDLAKKVYLIHRRQEFRGGEDLLNKVRAKANIELITDSTVTKAIANEAGLLDSIELNNGERTIELAGLFVAIGFLPETEIFEGLLDLTDDGYVKSQENCHTNMPGIFVAGDSRAKELRQLVTATADGAIAATEAIKYLKNLSS